MTRADIVARVEAAVIEAVDGGQFGDASGHLGGDGFSAIAEAAVKALEKLMGLS